MDNVKVEVDNLAEVLRIEVNDKIIFLGNYWDFDVPSSLIKLLVNMPGIRLNVLDKEIKV